MNVLQYYAVYCRYGDQAYAPELGPSTCTEYLEGGIELLPDDLFRDLRALEGLDLGRQLQEVLFLYETDRIPISAGDAKADCLTLTLAYL